LDISNFYRDSSQISAASELADSAILVRRVRLIVLVILLLLMPGRLICGKLHVLMRVMCVRLHDIGLFDAGQHNMAVTTMGLHGNRSSQRVAAEQRQPNGQQHSNELSEWAIHIYSLAKLTA
jgi:hypothetical protein